MLPFYGAVSRSECGSCVEAWRTGAPDIDRHAERELQILTAWGVGDGRPDLQDSQGGTAQQIAGAGAGRQVTTVAWATKTGYFHFLRPRCSALRWAARCPLLNTHGPTCGRGIRAHSALAGEERLANAPAPMWWLDHRT